MIPLAMGFRHLHPAMSKLEVQNKDYGETQLNIGIKSLKYFNSVLSESEFVAGDRYTFADIQMITTTDFFIGLNRLELKDYPEIERHTKLMSQRKSFSA
jgi:glutathione S-transferase